MFLVVGLGNIGKKYEKTRHNIGFMILDKFSKEFNIEFNKENNTCNYGIGNVMGKKVILVKPKTYMNLSGDAVVEIINYFKINLDDLLVIYDDISLDFLKIRIRQKGSHGGHNGIKDIINKINTEKFKRIKITTCNYKNIFISFFIYSIYNGRFRRTH